MSMHMLFNYVQQTTYFKDGDTYAKASTEMLTKCYFWIVTEWFLQKYLAYEQLTYTL